MGEGSGKQISQHCDAHSDFPWGSPGCHQNWFQWRERVDGPHRRVHIFSPHFLTFYWWLVALNAHHLKETLNRTWNVHATQKAVFDLKNVRQKPEEAFWGYRYIKLCTKFDAATLLKFLSLCSNHSMVLIQDHKATVQICRQCYVKWQTDSAGLRVLTFHVHPRICQTEQSWQVLSGNFPIPPHTYWGILRTSTVHLQTYLEFTDSDLNLY